MDHILSTPLRELIARVVAAAGYALEALESDGRTLRVFVDRAGGISLGECARVSEVLSAELDKADLIPERYFLEVSSPGLERRLEGIEDFARESGRHALVVTTKGVFEGIIGEVNQAAGTIELRSENNTSHPADVALISIRDVKRARRRVTDEELFGRRRIGKKRGRRP
ncbi:MAG: hypothetical protein ABIK62_06265 [candidate division WOR-3 bacterium]